jgi:hypothetical protein
MSVLTSGEGTEKFHQQKIVTKAAVNLLIYKMRIG